MSQKITSKNLSYDDSLPPFLARLRNQHAASASDPDPILASRRRAAKPRSASEEAEDGPLVVDEEGFTVRGVTVGKDGVVTEETAAENDGEGGEGKKNGQDPGNDKDKNKNNDKTKEEKVAAIGAGRKRKVGKVVGGDDDEAEDEGAQAAARRGTERAKANKGDQGKEPPTKGKKKAKKIKLSFGDDDGA